MTGADVAESFLAQKKICNVQVEEGDENTYSVWDGAIKLERRVYFGNGTGAATVAAHEAAHAVQMAERYLPLRINLVLGPMAYLAPFAMAIMVGLRWWIEKDWLLIATLIAGLIPIAHEIVRAIVEVDAWERAKAFLHATGLESDDILARAALHTYLFGTAYQMVKLALKSRGKK